MGLFNWTRVAADAKRHMNDAGRVLHEQVRRSRRTPDAEWTNRLNSPFGMGYIIGFADDAATPYVSADAAKRKLVTRMLRAVLGGRGPRAAAAAYRRWSSDSLFEVGVAAGRLDYAEWCDEGIEPVRLARFIASGDVPE